MVKGVSELVELLYEAVDISGGVSPGDKEGYTKLVEYLERFARKQAESQEGEEATARKLKEAEDRNAQKGDDDDDNA